MIYWKPAVLFCAALLLPSSPPMPSGAGKMPGREGHPDLDVGVPPGSPTTWGQRFPAITPRRGVLFPETPRAPVRPGGTVAQPTRRPVEIDIASSFGVVRILTWDLAAHLGWVTRTPPKRRAPVTGPGTDIALPRVPDGLYWAGMAAMLRRLLHPQVVSETGIAAHLVELGEPVRPVLANAAAERRLAPLCKTVRALIAAPAGHNRPLVSKTAPEAMWKRFLAQELVASHPYDPEGGFGARFFLFAEKLEGYLIEYTRHPSSFLRRNAVAAVGRCRSHAAGQALADLAADSKDPVVWARALAAAGARGSLPRTAALIRRLAAARHPVEREALIAALGRLRVTAAVPELLKLSTVRDPDVLLALATALARIPPGVHVDRVREFAARLVQSAGRRPEQFAVKRKGLPADIPDDNATRGRILQQIALCLQVRVGGKRRREAADALAGLAGGSKGPAGRRGGRSAGRARPPLSHGNAFENASMPRVLPPAQLLFVETLPLLGARGEEALLRIVQDATADPALRGHALAQLPLVRRGETCASLLAADATGDEIRVYALELLLGAGHASLGDICREILKAAGNARSTTATPIRKYLWLQAVRALSTRRQLRDRDALPLMKFVAARARRSGDVAQRLRERLEVLAEDVTAGLSKKARAARIDRLLEFVQVHRLVARLDEARLAGLRKATLQRLDGLRGHKGDLRVRAMVIQDLMQILAGITPARGLQGRASFTPVVPFEEEILLALGRTATPPAIAALRDFLEKRPTSPVRAHAALALGLTGNLAVVADLLPLLEEPDGFTRLCAYESLRNLTGRDYFSDWLYGEPEAWAAAAQRYRRLVGR